MMAVGHHYWGVKMGLLGPFLVNRTQLPIKTKNPEIPNEAKGQNEVA